MTSMQKKTAETFDSFEGRYSEAVNDSISFTGLDVDFFTRVKARYIKELTIAHFGSTRTLNALDIGCGVGNFHGLLKGSFGKLHGIDVSEASIDKAKATYEDVDYRQYDGGRLPYDDQSMDLAFTICVMHHVPSETWPQFVSEMYRVIKPGGLAMVFEHNPLNPLTMRAVNNCPFDEDAELLKSGKTKSLLQDAGFQNVKARFIISVPPANGTLMAIDRLFSRVPFGAQYYVSATRG